MMDRQDRVQQSFGQTSLGPGAIANQGFFQQCTFNTNIGLTLEQLQLFFTNILPVNNSTIDPYRIFTSVTQLGFLGKSEGKADAQSVVGNISSILQAISQPVVPLDPNQDTATLKHKANQADQTVRDEALAVIQKILTVSDEVHVNQPVAICRRGPGDTESISMSRITHESCLPHCQVRLQTWKCEFQQTRGQKCKYEQFTAKIDIQPELEGDPERKPYISVYLQRIHHPLGQQTFLAPIIIARRTIPDNSLVFRLIKDGDFEGFQELLRNREASLWDCDSRGRSLITYAVDACQPELCNYLIKNGADIDCVEPSLGYYGDRRHLLSQVDFEDYMIISNLSDENRRRRANECRRYLLDAGADPTIGGPESILFQTLDQLFDYSPVLELILQLGSQYIDTKERDSRGRTLLLQHCAVSQFGPTYLGIRTLLQLGSTPDERDNEGNTCLHLCLCFYADWGLNHIEELDDDGLPLAMVYLIRAGADVNAQNHDGETPTDLVGRLGETRVHKFWNSVLRRCNKIEEDEEEDEEDKVYHMQL
ncbi:ankyrin repeat-containing domain protein [Aspergillus cavernicola]|uniref:Ankyrin repeat-containing domain protein n=1 Tax=Aspergillus cavernicola TaxID=176166 RepID=A0ABR4IYR5_9EURO